MANTVTLSNGRTQSTSSPGSVVFGNDACPPRSDDTPITGPVRPPSRHAASVWASRSSDGTRTRTRPARRRSAARTATRLLPDPVAMITCVLRPRSGAIRSTGVPSARTTASTASRW